MIKYDKMVVRSLNLRKGAAALKMGKKLLVCILFAVSLTLSSCSVKDNKHVKIAVLGDPETFYTDYERGIDRAVRDLNDEYADTGFTFEYVLCDDDNSYNLGAAEIDRLNDDTTVTAVIAPNNKDINRLAAYVFNKENMLFVIPYALYDSVFYENYYDTVFSLAYPKMKIGSIMRRAAARTDSKRWAACIDSSELAMSELHGFTHENDDGIELVDCVTFNSINKNSEDVFRRWKILGVDGILLFSTSAQFDEFKTLKKEFPDAEFALDSVYDDSALLLKDNELMRMMTNVIQAVDFPGYPHNDEDKKKFEMIKKRYNEEFQRAFDLWYLHAYNMIRMIGDTAVQCGSNDSKTISEMIHKNGYDGICAHYKFSPNGDRTDDSTEYGVYSDDGRAFMMSLDE